MSLKKTDYLYQYYKYIDKYPERHGIEIQMIMDQLINDIDNKQYTFNVDYAHKRINFIEKFARHTKSPYYNHPFILELWQKAFFEALYSFYIYSDEFKKNILRFKECLLLVARKNGKTTLMAADALYDLLVGQGGQLLTCASNNNKDANVLWEQINSMRLMLDRKGIITHKNQTYIINKINGNRINKMYSTMKTFDGGYVNKAYIDESHEAKDDKLPHSLTQGTATQENSLLINVTTEGTVNDGYLDNKLYYAQQVLNGEIDNIHFLSWLYTQDSEQEIWEDKNSWYKANPSLNSVKKVSYLEDRIKEAKLLKSARVTMLTKDFNIKQANGSAWLMLEDYDYPMSTFDLEDFRRCVCVGAVDLSATTDLTSAKVMLFKPDDKTKYIYSHYWIPESKLTESDDKTSGAKYQEWARDGYLTIIDGHSVTVSVVADWFYELYEKYRIITLYIGYDNKFSNDFLSRCENYGLKYEQIPQNRRVMSNPMKLTESELKAKLINYNNNPVDKWCLGNAGIDVDNLERIMCVKIRNQKNKRIDGAVTLIMLYVMLEQHRTDILQRMKEMETLTQGDN